MHIRAPCPFVRTPGNELQAKIAKLTTTSMLSCILNQLVAALALGATVRSQNTQNATTTLVSRRLTEFLMPVATEKHELGRVTTSNFVLLSQMLDSKLIKIELDLTTEEPIALQPFRMGESSNSGLHGVWPSSVYLGKMWLTLQSDNKLMLVDPGNLSTAPSIIKTIETPKPGNAPHCISEIGNRI
jgi:virginiamycin B lyase